MEDSKKSAAEVLWEDVLEVQTFKAKSGGKQKPWQSPLKNTYILQIHSQIHVSFISPISLQLELLEVFGKRACFAESDCVAFSW